MATTNTPGSAPQRPRQAALASPRPRQAPRRMLRPQRSQWAPFLRIFPMIILLIGLLLPVEVRFNLAGQTLYAYRMAWILVAPWVLMQVFSGRLRLRFNDVLVVLTVVWITLSFVIVYGFERGGPAGVALALDILIPYLAARLAIRSFDDFRIFLIAVAPFALGISALMVIEAVTHTRIIRGAGQAVFGSIGAAEYGVDLGQAKLSDTRMGLLRATGPFSHPILAGLFFTSLLPLYWFSMLRRWPFLAGLSAAAGAIFSLSSAAFIGIFMFVVLATYDRLRKMVTFLNWPIFIFVALAFLATIHLVSEGGLISIIIRSTLNPASGYYRLLIWEYGSASVLNYPWFGIGYEQFKGLPWMLPSVDSFWLATAIRNGLPPALLCALATILSIAGLAMNASRQSGVNATLLIGIAITMTMFFVLGFTVSFFGNFLIWFAMILGVATTFGAIVPTKHAVKRRQVRRPISQR